MGSSMGLITKRDFLDEEQGKEYRDLIKGFDANQVTPAGYDFRAAECINLTLGDKVKLTEGAKYQIRHGDFVIVITRESLNLGNRNDIFGQVYSKVSFAIQGLSHVGTKIDPGFAGPLVLSFKNEGYDIIEITGDTAICNVALQIISPPTEALYNRGSFEYPTLTERPRLPFPLREENWEELSRWYSREAFETYSQWSEELSKLREYLLTQQIELETKLIARLNEGTQQLAEKLTQETAALMSEVGTLSESWKSYKLQIDAQSKQFENNVRERVNHIEGDIKERTDRIEGDIKEKINHIEGDIKERTRGIE